MATQAAPEPAPRWYTLRRAPVIVCCLLIAAAFGWRILALGGNSDALGAGIAAVMCAVWLGMAWIARTARERMTFGERLVAWLLVPLLAWYLVTR
jgi:hypothetical protein